MDKQGRFDAALEEVWHVITYSGYSDAYPEVFGENTGTALTDAMDIARGGNFTSIPENIQQALGILMMTKHVNTIVWQLNIFYWGMTSILGAQENRLNEISQEWDLNTRILVENIDTSIYALLTNPLYKFPSVLPDGTYRQ